ncbi:MAG: primosomal protein N' [Paludibacteraceae bacterium]|nr:primosomal protein N' [Paludibacteraceae bacterium]
MDASSRLYAQVWLPVLSDGYTYGVPEQLQGAVVPGSLVRVPLGRRRNVVGLAVSVGTQCPDGGFVVRDIESVVSDHPTVTAQQLELWRWMAGYYLCTCGEVLRAALPTALSDGSYRPAEIICYREGCGDGSSLTAKGRALLEAFRQMGGEDAVPRTRLLPVAGPSVLATLLKHGYLQEEVRTVSRFPKMTGSDTIPGLSGAQQRAFDEVLQGFGQSKPVLLHGITSSGKTVIYMHLIRRCLEQGRRALLLVPEIGLTAQLTERLRAVFGDRLAAYHSKLSDNERAEIYEDLLSGNRFQVILGVRSALFLPLDQVGLVIVDEEQEPSYKQYEPAPRYHARHVALMLAHLRRVPLVLGSATPSMESYYWAGKGKYALVTLTERYGGVQPPEVVCVDREYAFKTNRMRGMYSRTLLQALRDTVDGGGQAILFQNRRGFSSSLECPQCGWMPKCPHCDVPLVYHKRTNQLVCHYCGSKAPVAGTCPKCGPVELQGHGYGTEQVVEQLKELMPDVTVDRMDIDSTQSKHAYDRMIARFASGETQVLVGTQLVAKGFDFERVGLVGVVNADNLLAFPDFRAQERAFQVLTQVAGRAGRRSVRGKVVVQSSQLGPELLQALCGQDTDAFYRTQLEERRMFGYPPYCRLVSVTLRHRDEALLERTVNGLCQRLRERFGDRLLGPQAPGTGRVQDQAVRQFLLKFTLKDDLTGFKAELSQALSAVRSAVPTLRVVVDVDPV